MAPTYRDGDRVLVRRVGVDRLRRGQVVVVERPEPDGRWRPAPDPGPRRWIIKRVAALPGEPVPEGIAGTGDGTVPVRMLALLGDNPAASFDSRQVGFFPAERLLGVAVRRLGSVP